MAVTVKLGSRNPLDNGLGTNLGGGLFKLDVSDQIDLVAPERDIAILRTIGWGASAEDVASGSIGADSLSHDCTSQVHSWLNDVLVPVSGTLTSSYTSGGGTLTVGTTQVNYFRVNDIIKVTSSSVSAPNNEVFYLVTSINTGAGTVAVTVINTDQNAANTDPWVIMGNAQKVGGDANASTTAMTTAITRTENYTQILQGDAYVTGSDESVEQYGITDPMARELAKEYQRLIVQFEKLITFGYRSSSLPTASTTAARMGGIFYWTRVASGGLTKDLAGDPISEKALDDAIDTIWRAGGTPDTLVCNSVGLREMRKFLRPFVETTRSERAAGLIFDRYESAVGLDLDVVLDRHLGDSDFLILSKQFLGVGPLKGNGQSRAFTAREVLWQGSDYRHFNIRGEYTMEVRNFTTHHMWIYGGASTVSS